MFLDPKAIREFQEQIKLYVKTQEEIASGVRDLVQEIKELNAHLKKTEVKK